MKSIRTIRPVSAEELTTLLVSLEGHRTYCKDQLARARSVDLDQELFWNERIDRCSLLLNDLCGLHSFFNR